MPFIECPVFISLPKNIKDYILSKKELYKRQGLDEPTSERKAIEDFKKETVENLADIHTQLGNEKFKIKENAVSKQSTNEMDVRQQTENGEGVGAGNTQSEESAGESGGKPPIENKGETTGEEEELTKMANAFNDAQMEGKFGADALDKVLSQLQDTDTKDIYNKVKEKIKKGTINVKDVRDRVMTTQHGSEADQAVLLYDLAELKGKEDNLMKEINSETDPKKIEDLQKQLMSVQNDMNDNWLADRSIGRSASNIFRIRQLYAKKDMSLAEMTDQYKASKGIKNLTPEQEKELKTAYTKIRELDAKRKAAKEQLDKALQENEKLITENEALKKLAETSKKQTQADRSKKNDEKIKSSKERIDAARDRLRKLGGNLNVGINPQVAIELTKIAAEHFYQGAVKFSEVVQKVWDDVKDVIPNFSKEDVRNHLLANAKEASKKYYQSSEGVTLSNKGLQDKIKAYKEVQKDYALKVFEWQKNRRLDIMATRPFKEKMIDYILRWQRFAILSYPSTMVKLAAVVIHQIAFKPFKFAAQFITHQITKAIDPNFAAKQTLWGNPTARALGKYYSTLIRNFSLANLKEHFSGIDTKKIMYGESGNYDEWAAAKGFLEMPGRSHGYMKSFIKNPEFQYAQEMITSKYIDRMMDLQEKIKKAPEAEKEALQQEYDKYDITNEEVMDRVNKLSLDHSEWAILMNKNSWASKFQNWADKKEIGSALVRSEVPIIKIPLNYIGRSFATKYGFIRAIAGKGRWENNETNFPGIVEMIFKGTKNITPEQADLFGKAITLGSMGAAFFALGYINRKDIIQNDDGSVQFFGKHVSRNLVHSPELESMFSGATTANEYSEEDKKNAGKWLKDFLESDFEILKKNPFASMLKYGMISNVASAFLDKNASRNKTEEKITDAVSRKVADMAIPGFVKQPAQWIDTKEKGLHPMEQPNQRYPSSHDLLERFWQQIEVGIPGLRENVPVHVAKANGLDKIDKVSNPDRPDKPR